MTDPQLLERFVQHGDQSAFADLVRRHVDWICSMATRLTSGNCAMAEDVTQAVFILLAKKSASLRKESAISNWLFVVTRYCANNARRNERTRRQREQEAAAMRNEVSAPSAHWEELSPLLDELVAKLRWADRQAVLLRFYQSKTFPEIGAVLSVSEEAARKRVSRAIEQLRTAFARRGVTVGAAALAATMSANLTQPASAAAIAGAAAAPGATTPLDQGISSMMTWMSIKPIAVLVGSVLLLAGTTATVLQVTGGENRVGAAPTTMPTTESAVAAPRAVRYGRVVDENDKPVNGAKVWQIEQPVLFGAWETTASTTSNADGRFEFPIRTDYARVLVQATGYGLAGTFFSTSGTTSSDPIEVRVKPPARLRATFVDPTGRPAVNLRVRLSGVGSSETTMHWGVDLPPELGESFGQITDAQGTCVFPLLPQGGMASVDPADERFAQMDDVRTFNLSDMETTDAGTIRLQLGGSISGRLLFADSRKPAAGIQVVGYARVSSRSIKIAATSDAEGRYHLKQLPGAVYDVSVLFSDTMRERYAAAAKQKIRITPGLAAKDQDFAVITGGIIRGRIVEKGTGKPLAGMGVFIDGPSQPNSTFTPSPKSNDDGVYLMHVAPGAQSVQLALPMPPGLLEPKPLTYNVTVAENQTVELNYEVPRNPATSAKGRVVDPDGHPLAGVKIYGQSSDDYPPGKLLGTSDSDGNFVISIDSPGTMIRASRARWTTLQPLAVNAGQSDLKLTLHNNAQASVRVRITQPDGKPIAGAKVELTSRQRVASGPQRKTYFDEKTTPADGTCLFELLSPDIDYGFSVHAKGFGRGEIKFPIEPGKLVDAPTITLAKADSFVGGMVIDETGLPVSNIRITLSTEKSDPEQVRTDITGRFRVGNIVPGDKVSISASDDDGTRGGALRDVAAGSEGLVITLQATPKRP